MALGVCWACAKPLKDKAVATDHGVVTIKVCKSPICRLYNQGQ